MYLDSSRPLLTLSNQTEKTSFWILDGAVGDELATRCYILRMS